MSAAPRFGLPLQGHDPDAVRKTCNGWYWSVVPAILVGLTVRYAAWLCMYGFQRGQQTKRSLLGMMKNERRIRTNVLAYLLALAGLICLTTWTFVRDKPYEAPEREIDYLDFILD